MRAITKPADASQHWRALLCMEDREVRHFPIGENAWKKEIAIGGRWLSAACKSILVQEYEVCMNFW